MYRDTLRGRARLHPESPERLAAMGRQQRLSAYRRGAFTRAELNAWTARYPEEVPLLNGELPWIARQVADLD